MALKMPKMESFLAVGKGTPQRVVLVSKNDPFWSQKWAIFGSLLLHRDTQAQGLTSSPRLKITYFGHFFDKIDQKYPQKWAVF